MTDEDRRRSTRSRSLLGAQIIFNGGFSTLDCLVRNVSATGARLQISDTVAVPRQFEIRIHQKGAWNADVRWRTEREIGVQLTPIVAD
jgi:hypothetical protein